MGFMTFYRFAAGDRVRVSDEIVGTGNMAGHLPCHGQIVTVVAYWRNGYFHVREDSHGTTCAIGAEHLTLIDPEQAAVARAIASGDVQRDWDRQAS